MTLLDADMGKTKASNGVEVKKTTSLVFFCFILLAALFCSLAYVDAQPSPFVGDIRITPDGTVEGTNKISRDGNVYTLIGDLSGSVENGQTFISIEKDNVIFDGAGKTIGGSGTGVAIEVIGRKDVTIKNTRIINFGTGIELRAFDWNVNTTATNNRILDNYLETTYWGIDLNTENGVVLGNKIISTKSYFGVNFRANKTLFSNNEFVKGGLVIFEPCYQNVLSGNTVNGEPLAYLERQANQVIDGAGQVVLIDCDNMIVRNVPPTVGLRVTITLFGTSDTQITNCVGNIALKNSHSNIIINNELRTASPIASFQDSAIELTASYNNTIASNSITATKGYGVSIVASTHNKIRGNDISSSGYAAIKVEVIQVATSPEQQVIPAYNYVYENNLTCTESGISLRSARNTVVFRNSIFNCKDAIMLSGSHESQILGNNITGSTQYAIHLGVANDNSFYHNNFLDNAMQAYENHKVYWWYVQNDTYYSEGNTFDNGEEGNYWDTYYGSDTNGDGIGETPFNVYENFTDRYPLTTPFDIRTVTVDFAEWNPQSSPDQPGPSDDGLHIVILSPENTTYSTTEIPLNLIVSQQMKWLGYRLDSQAYATISGNTTLTGLAQGTHSLTVYGNTMEGALASSETIVFNVKAPGSSAIVPVAAISVSLISIVAVGLLLYRRKRPREVAGT